MNWIAKAKADVETHLRSRETILCMCVGAIKSNATPREEHRERFPIATHTHKPRNRLCLYRVSQRVIRSTLTVTSSALTGGALRDAGSPLAWFRTDGSQAMPFIDKQVLSRSSQIPQDCLQNRCSVQIDVCYKPNVGFALIGIGKHVNQLRRYLWLVKDAQAHT